MWAVRTLTFTTLRKTLNPTLFFSNRQFSSKVLVVGEYQDNYLTNSTLSTITAANQIGKDVSLYLLGGGNVDAAAKSASQIEGVSKVLVTKDESLATLLAEKITPQLLALQKESNFTHILAPSSSFGKNILPRLAANLDVSPLTDVIGINGADVFKRPTYAGNALVTLRLNDPVKLLTVRSTAFAKAKTSGGSASIEERAAVSSSDLSSHEGYQLTKSDRPELTSARIVVSGGRALKSRENFFSVLEPLANKLKAALGASRAAVDAGYAPNDLQVGQTGKIVAPDVYIALGISGAIQHVTGMKDSKVVVVINKDADAPFFQIADYGLVGDIFTVVPELVSKLK